MYIYRIIEEEINEEYEDGFRSDFTYITHDLKFSEVEFNEICKKAKGMVGKEVVYSFQLVKVLCSEFGFEGLNPVATYQYEYEM